MCDDNGCVVTVEWSEPFISCAGSVSQYVLSVTPPTSECQSGSGSGDSCMLMTDQTQYNLTLAMDQTYTITVRADICDNTLTGDSSDPISVTVVIYGNIRRVLYTHYTHNLQCIFYHSNQLYTCLFLARNLLYNYCRWDTGLLSNTPV